MHGSITILFMPPVAPVITPASGVYYEPELIEIDNYTEGDLGFYFTTDGTIPTISSNKYTGPLVMLPGSSVYKFVCIDDNGLLSDISTVKYNFNIEYNVGAEQAHDMVLNYLYLKGTTSGPDGALETGGMVGFRLVRIASDTIGYKYIFEEYIFNDNGELTELDTRYSVDLITGEVEKAE